MRFVRIAPIAVFFYLGCNLLAADGQRAAAAAPETPDAEFGALLETGEFSSALRSAQAAPSATQRDEKLARIAAAQAQAGAIDASLRAAGAIGDDRSRARALEEVVAARGGAAEADFDSLIDLITATIVPNSWDDVGGPGAIDGFAGGVFVDAQGVLKPLLRQEPTGRLTALRSASRESHDPTDVRRFSRLRKISLPRLERQVQLGLAAGRRPDEAMQVLAGLRRIQYVFVYPESGDVVIAGPAGDWRVDAESRVVNTETGSPVIRLDDLVVIFRHMLGNADAQFGCSITPTQENLAEIKTFLAASAKQSLRQGERDDWLETLRSRLGRQEIDVYGLDPRTRPARVLVEADYRMKLVGMGLEEGTLGVESYLDSIDVPRGQAPPPMNVLRWWFTLNYDAVLATDDRRGFEIRGQGVKVLSENELLTAQGKRVHTGASDELNRRFAHNFTAHFEAMATKYPVYAELRNMFDLALTAAIINAQDLPGQIGWHLTCFGEPDGYQVPLAPAPQHVDTVINHRVIHRVHVVAGVSGGVSCNPAPLVAPQAIKTDHYGKLAADHHAAIPQDLPRDAWWWD